MQIAKQHLIFFKLYEALLDAGVNKQKAEAAIQEIAENIPSKLEQNSILENIATKEDLKNVKEDVKEDIKKLELKLELKIEKSKNQTITLMTIIIGLLLAFFQFFDKI